MKVIILVSAICILSFPPVPPNFFPFSPVHPHSTSLPFFKKEKIGGVWRVGHEITL